VANQQDANMNIQRQFTKMAIKGGGDDAKVAILLNGFDEVDKVLTKVIEASKSWRDAWISILSLQLGIVTDFEGISYIVRLPRVPRYTKLI